MVKSKQTKEKSSRGITITAGLQISFLASVALLWLASIAASSLPALFYAGYVGLGTWLFQASMWLHPLLFFVIALFYSWKKFPQLLPKLFSAALVATVGVFFYGGVSSIINMFRYRYNILMPDSNSSGIINAFGYDWLIMLIGLVLFGLVLGMSDYRKRGK